MARFKSPKTEGLAAATLTGSSGSFCLRGADAATGPSGSPLCALSLVRPPGPHGRTLSRLLRLSHARPPVGRPLASAADLKPTQCRRLHTLTGNVGGSWDGPYVGHALAMGAPWLSGSDFCSSGRSFPLSSLDLRVGDTSSCTLPTHQRLYIFPLQHCPLGVVALEPLHRRR